MALGRRVRERRRARGFSQERLAREAGVTWSAIQRLEAGQVNDPHYSTLSGIANALNTTVAELIGEPAVTGKDEAADTRQAVYEPLLEYVNNYATRWEQKLDEGSFDRGSLVEFWDNNDDFGPALRRLGLQEKREQPSEADSEGTFGPVIGRLLGLSMMLREEGGKMLGENDLARVRRQHDELAELAVGSEAEVPEGQESRGA